MSAAVDFRKKSFASNLRLDKWWVEPVLVLLGLTVWIVYSTWSALQGEYYWWNAGAEGFGGYLSPYYSPTLFILDSAESSAPMSHAWFGAWPSWWPSFLPASPSLFVLIIPGIFRFTCYYYRGAYYKAFAGTPPGCAVGSIPQKNFKGETLLLVFQNIHRYAFYLAVLYLPILYYDAFMAFFRDGVFGIGLGSIVLLLNPVFLCLYFFGCHSLRHLVGGRNDCFSCAGSGSLRHGAYQKVSWLNRHHKLFAWISLIWMALTDLYVRLVAQGDFMDINTWV